MRLFSWGSFNKEFDFRSAGRWLLLGSIVGVISGLCAILFQSFLVLVKEFSITHLMGLSPMVPGGEHEALRFTLGKFNPYFIVLLPALGGLVAGLLIYKFAPEAEGHGTDEAIKAFHRKRGIIRPSVPIIKLLASVITIGTGGSGGREGPIAQIGAGFGSFLATRLNFDAKTRRWLLAAGMGAGIGSIFRAPLAGAIFAAEVLYSSTEVEAEVILPAAVSSIIAFSVYSFRYGWDHIFSNAGQHGFTQPLELIPYTIEALLLAFAALIFVKSFYGIRKIFTDWNIPKYIKPFIGGLLTGGLVLLMMQLTGDHKFTVDIMGGGYGILQEIMQNGITKIGLGILLLVAAGKILATSFTIGSGGSAGVFGPSMVIGGTLGAASGYLLQFIFPGFTLYPSTFAIVGMAGFFAAAANTPISTIIMVSELTGNYELLMPSMWVCTISFLVARKWSIYQSQVPGKIYSQAHFGEYAHDIFKTITVRTAFNKTKNNMTLQDDMPVENIIITLKSTKQRMFPVINKEKQLIGTFYIKDIPKLLQKSDNEFKTVADIMQQHLLKISLNETIDKAQAIMLHNHVDELVVVDDFNNPDNVLGIITTADIIKAYNRELNLLKSGKEKPESLPGDESLLKHMNLNKVLEKGFLTVDPEATLGDLVNIFTKAKRNIFPVINKENQYFGIIMLNDIRKLLFDVDKYNSVIIKDIMIQTPEIVHIEDRMEQVMKKLEKAKTWNLPVIDSRNRYLGMVSQSTIFSYYRHQLLYQTET
ncbi:MAG TPA: chloride channel protein [Bacteroidales bacterium]|nr:chloride channel protein [Bacteroidales bacterium]